jgi:hypothetical protein
VVVVPLFAVVVVPLLAVVVPLFAVVAPPPALAPPPLVPWDAGAEACAAGAALGAGALLFFCPQARPGTVIRRLRTKSHLATMLMLGRVDFIVTLLLV